MPSKIRTRPAAQGVVEEPIRDSAVHAEHHGANGQGEWSGRESNLRFYEPDCVAVTSDGRHHLVETKGREDVDVAHKDSAAALWCENAAALTGTAWQYTKVQQTKYESLEPTLFGDLVVLSQ